MTHQIFFANTPVLVFIQIQICPYLVLAKMDKEIFKLKLSKAP